METYTHVAVAVDHIEQCLAIARAAESIGVTVPVLIEVDIGMGRSAGHDEPAFRAPSREAPRLHRKAAGIGQLPLARGQGEFHQRGG